MAELNKANEQRFDRLLKAMAHGDPPKGKRNPDKADKSVDESRPKNHDS
jgi:hypothetical protein